MSASRMHAGEVDTDVELVRRLLAGQFPQWADRPVEPVPSAGTDNALYRLGDDVEIACDESGYEGERLIGTTTDLFTHASISLDPSAAASCVQQLRAAIRSPAREYRAGHVLRERHRPVLEWLLGPSGPLDGHARVFLVDKAFFLLGRLVDLLVADVPHRRAMTVTLYRDGARAFGRGRWEAFLVAANDLLRVKDRLDVRTSVESFFGMVDVLRRAGAPGSMAEIVGLLSRSRSRADAFRGQLASNPTMIPPLDALIVAIVHAVLGWGTGGRPVSVVHDRQKALTDGRIAQLRQLVGLAGLTLVHSATDPRVQLADILAGAAREIATDELHDRGDATLTVLLRPYVDPLSIWGDDRSWARLAPATIGR